MVRFLDKPLAHGRQEGRRPLAGKGFDVHEAMMELPAISRLYRLMIKSDEQKTNDRYSNAAILQKKYLMPNLFDTKGIKKEK